MDQNNNSGNAPLVLLLAVVIVAAVSILPLERLSNGRLSDFNLIGDILPKPEKPDYGGPEIEEPIDPALAVMDSIDDDSIAQEIPVDQLPPSVATPLRLASSHLPDSLLPTSRTARLDSLVTIEDYTDGRGLSYTLAALRSGRLTRIAVVGDSYIEGDIFSQDLRALLQQQYGGSGVGYMNLFTQFPGFRQSVKQEGSGWTEWSIQSKGVDKSLMALSEHYFTPSGNAHSTYKGVKKPHLGSWQQSQFLFIARKPASITVSVNGVSHTYSVDASPSVQAIRVVADSMPTSSFGISTSSEIAALGVWLDDSIGVSVDCMSSRGYSGVTLTDIDASLCHDMSNFIQYQLIILEFGINVLNAKQTDYSFYTKKMVRVIEHMRECYPRADILLMGVGDRGSKSGTGIHSMHTITRMVEAQRLAARRAQCLFWDTREAMGGDDAIVEWSSNGFANKDYIHLTHKGGRRLADLLFKAIQHAADQK